MEKVVYGGNFFGVMAIDEMKWEFLKPYLVYTVAFSTGVYTNMMCLNQSNVETVIVARACSPLIVSFLDPIFLGRELPSRRSIAALSVIVVGAFGYASTDDVFKTQGLSAYFWPTLYLGIITFEMVYGKKIVNGVKFKTLSGPVQYTNLLGWPPMLMFAKAGGEFERLNDLMKSYDVDSIFGLLGKLPTESIALLILGCFIGTGIGYTGWWCRGKVSATSFTLIGVLNKCMTVIVNMMIWDQHANAAGTFSLFLCLVGGSLYTQSPMKKRIEESSPDVELAQSDSGVNNDENGLTKRSADNEENLTVPLIQKSS